TSPTIVHPLTPRCSLSSLTATLYLPVQHKPLTPSIARQSRFSRPVIEASHQDHLKAPPETTCLITAPPPVRAGGPWSSAGPDGSPVPPGTPSPGFQPEGSPPLHQRVFPSIHAPTSALPLPPIPSLRLKVPHRSGGFRGPPLPPS